MRLRTARRRLDVTPERPGADASGRTRPLGVDALPAPLTSPWQAAAWLIVVAATAVTADIAARHAFAGTSDGASLLMEARSVLRGNVTLSHWALSLDSFWTVEVPFYVVAVAVAGVTPALYDAVPAVIAALVVGVGAVLARAGRPGRGAWAGPLTVFALLGLPGVMLTDHLDAGGQHVATTLFCLLAFVGLRRGRFGWGWALALAALTAGLLGDLETAALGAVPVICAGVASGLRLRSPRAALPAVSAGAGSFVLAGALRIAADVIGTFSLGAPNPTAAPAQLAANAHLGVYWAAGLLGVGAVSRGPLWAQYVDVLGLAAVVAGVAWAAVSLLHGMFVGRPGSLGGADWRIDDLLVLGALGDALMFGYLTPSANDQYARYLTPGVIFGSVLAARLVSRWAARRSERRASSRIRPMAVPAVALAVTVVFDFGFAGGVRGPAVRSGTGELRSFLMARGLHEGIGDYWDASAITVYSHDKIRVRPVAADTSTSPIGRYMRESDASWYAGKAFQFLVFNTALPWGDIGSTSARNTFGPPERTYAVGTYRVLVWAHPVRVPANP